MINRTVQILGGVLVAQLVLAAITWMPSGTATTAKHPLLGIGRDAISSITVTSYDPTKGESAPVQLTKSATGWSIATSSGYPADAEKVDGLLDKLVGINVGDPVATTAASFDQLSVGDSSYTRKVVVEGAGASTTLLFGSGSASAANVRIAGDDAAYIAPGFTAWTISDQARGYWNNQFIDVDPAGLVGLTVTRPGLPDLVFTHGGTWTVEGLPEGVQADSGAVERLVGGLTKVRMSDVAASGANTGLAMGLHVSFEGAQGTTLDTTGYTIGSVESGKVYLRTDEASVVVTAPKAPFETIRAGGPEQWAIGAAPAAPPQPNPAFPGGRPPGMPR